MKKRSLSVILSTVLGLVFILSGFVKAVDPVGFSYKIEEYLSMFGMYGMKEWSVPLAVMSCAMETFLGMIVLLRVWKRTAAMISVAVMLVFTVITLNTLVNPLNTITECGCFGEAVHLSNGASFAKNLVLLTMTVIYLYCEFRNNCVRGFEGRQLILPAVIFALSFLLPIYSCLFLSPFYFLDYNVGDRIGYGNRIELFDRNLEHARIDMTGTVRPLYIIGLRREMTDKEAAKIAVLHKAYSAKKVDIIAASPSFSLSTGHYADIPLYYIDETAPKSILRSETGVVVISDGRINGKWNLKHTACRFRGHYGKEITGQLLYRYGILASALAFFVFLCIVP